MAKMIYITFKQLGINEWFILCTLENYKKMEDSIDQLSEGWLRSLYLPNIVNIISLWVHQNPLYKQMHLTCEINTSAWSLSYILFHDLCFCVYWYCVSHLLNAGLSEPYEYIAPELFLLLMTSLFTFYHCLLSAIIFCRFRVVGVFRTLHLPYLTWYCTLPLILPFVTLHLTLPYLVL